MVPLGESHTERSKETHVSPGVATQKAKKGQGIQLTVLELELLDTSLVGGDGSALHTDRVLLDGLSGINGDLVVGLITVLEAEIVVLEVDVQVGEDELLLDVLPDHTGHLIAVELDDGVLDLDLGGGVGSHCATVELGIDKDRGGAGHGRRGTEAAGGRAEGGTRPNGRAEEGSTEGCGGDGRHGGKKRGGEEGEKYKR